MACSATILACAAGKHVYVEKPCCHNPREGELQVEAARKYKRTVQMGSQRRSWPAIIEAIGKLRDGVVGRVLFSRGWYNDQRGSIAHRTGHTLNCDPQTGRIIDDKQAQTLWSREYEPGWEPKV